MKKAKVYLFSLCAVLLVMASVLGTIAYLKSEDSVVNTFTVGNVKLNLDESAVTPDGTPIKDAARVKENCYHLIPGNTYTKDPTVTVLQNSEECYVRMLVTINCYDALTTIFGDDFLPQYFVSGWDNSVWISTQVIDVNTEADTATYEFRYKETVKPASDSDTILEALFDSITVPGHLDGDDMESIKDLKIVIIGHAIQKAGFADENSAWTAFDEQNN